MGNKYVFQPSPHTPIYSRPCQFWHILDAWTYFKLLQIIITPPSPQTPKFKNFVLITNPPSLLESYPTIRDQRVLLKLHQEINLLHS